MKERFKKALTDNPKFRKSLGVLLVIIGLISIVTPFTPVGFLLLVGLELLGLRLWVLEKWKKWFGDTSIDR